MAQEHQIDKRRGTRVLLSILAIWGFAVAVCAQTGVYHALPPLLLAPIIALGIVVPVIVYALSGSFRAYIEAIGLRPLTAFSYLAHRGRAAFFWYGAHNLLPEIFVQDAGWGDFIAGFLALGVILLPESRNRYLAFHLFGFADFVVAVGTGLIFFLLKDPRMSAIQTLPMALIILYGVGISGASHIMAFDLLRHHSGIEPRMKHAAVKA